MLQFQPGLSPDQVKWALVNSPRTALLDQPAGTAPAPTMAQVYAVIADPEGVPAANQGLTPSTYADPDTSFVDPNIYFTNIYFTNIYFTNSLPARSTFDN